MTPSDPLLILKQGDVPMKGRKVGILFDEGSDMTAIDDLRAAVTKQGGSVFTVAPKVGELALKGGKMAADGQFAGSPSVLFDAVAMVLMPNRVELLKNDSAALGWLMDAYSHCKTTGHCKGSKALIDRLGLEVDAGNVSNDDFAAIAPKRHWDREPKVRMLA